MTEKQIGFVQPLNYQLEDEVYIVRNETIRKGVIQSINISKSGVIYYIYYGEGTPLESIATEEEISKTKKGAESRFEKQQEDLFND